VLGGVGIRMAKASHCEAVVRHLDAAAQRGDIEPSTAIKVWGEVTYAFGQAVRSKVPSLRMREDDPTDKVAGPDRGIDKIKPVLFPDEVLRLLACEAVPLVRRRLYACAVYIGARANELLALTAADIDLEQGRIDIHKQRDRRTNGDRRTKTKRSRVPEIEPALAPLLTAMVRECPGGRLFVGHGVVVDEQRATTLRDDLRRASVDRAELFLEKDPTRLPLWFHHLRDTCLTWMAIRGDDPNRIEWRGGHTDFKTTQGYMAEGRRVGSLRVFRTVGPFPALPLAALGVLSGDADTKKDSAPEFPGNSGADVASPTGFEPVLAA